MSTYVASMTLRSVRKCQLKNSSEPPTKKLRHARNAASKATASDLFSFDEGFPLEAVIPAPDNFNDLIRPLNNCSTYEAKVPYCSS